MRKSSKFIALLLTMFLLLGNISSMAYAAEATEATVETESDENESEETTDENNDGNTDGSEEESTVDEETTEETETDETETEDDGTDTDGDGITDYNEKLFDTDINNTDTDGDGLSDYDEIYVITSEFTDPTLYDTDDDGICDANEDADEDGLDNATELSLGTTPTTADTDADGLTDGKEVSTYSTDPLLPDTDGDGATDAWEVKNGFDPVKKQSAFTMKIISSDGIATLEFSAIGSVAENTSISIAEVSEDSLGEVNQLSKVYEITAPSEGFSIATITISGSFNKSESPLIYRFDEDNETNQLTSVNTTVRSNRLSAKIVSAGKYVCLSNKEVENLEDDNTESVESSDVEIKEDTESEVSESVNTENKTLVDMCPDGAKDSNNDGISDEYTKLLCDGTILSGDYQKVFGDLTYKQVQATDDYDADALLNGQEIELLQDADGLLYAVILSSPVSLDTDEDGINDADDTAPLTYGLANDVVGNLRIVGKHDYSCVDTEGHSFLVYTSYVDNYDVNLKNLYAYYLLNKDKESELEEDESLYSWRVISSSTDSDSDAARLASADSLYTLYESAEENTTFTLQRGESICIGNFTQKSYVDSAMDAIVNSESIDTTFGVETLRILYSAYTGQTITAAYIIAHYALIMADAVFVTYAFGEDTLTGATEGGIWVNREMYDQAYQYDQFPNQIYGRDVTEAQVEKLESYLAENSYYNIFSHNCSSVATGAWNSLFGYETDEEGNYVLDNGSYVKTAYYLSARTTGIWKIIDLPMVVSDNIRALGTVLPDGWVTKDGSLIIVNGCDVTDTVNSSVNTYNADDEDTVESSTETTDSTASTSNESVTTDSSASTTEDSTSSVSTETTVTESTESTESETSETTTATSLLSKLKQSVKKSVSSVKNAITKIIKGIVG